MAKDPAFLFYPGDYLRDTQMLSEKAQVAYDRIMCEHMRNICITQQQLKFLTKRLSDEEKEELSLVLMEVEGGFQISWVAESIKKRRAYSESRRKNRSKKPDSSIGITSSTYDSDMENEIKNERIDGNRMDGSGKEGVQINFPFSDWWNLYDKKVDRKKAERKWNSLTEDQRTKAMEHTPNYVQSQPNKSLRRDPMTYLNNDSWENEIIENTSSSRDRNAKPPDPTQIPNNYNPYAQFQHLNQRIS